MIQKIETPAKTKHKRLKIEQVVVEITFCTHVGWDGVLVIPFSFGIAGLFVYITSLYTKAFQAWHRPGIWVFVLFAVLYTLSTLVYLFTWKKIAKSYSKTDARGASESFVGRIFDIRSMFSINGVLFLWKSYLDHRGESLLPKTFSQSARQRPDACPGDAFPGIPQRRKSE